MEHLEQAYSDNPLLPKSSAEKKLIHSICKEHEALHDPAIYTLSYANIFMSPDKRKSLDIPRILQLAKQHPNVERGEFMARAIQGGIDANGNR